MVMSTRNRVHFRPSDTCFHVRRPTYLSDAGFSATNVSKGGFGQASLTKSVDPKVLCHCETGVPPPPAPALPDTAMPVAALGPAFTVAPFDSCSLISLACLLLGELAPGLVVASVQRPERMRLRKERGSMRQWQ